MASRFYLIWIISILTRW